MQAQGGSGLDWRDSGAYAALLRADRSLFAWEWLRRDPRYRAAAECALTADAEALRPDGVAGEAAGQARDAAAFGLVSFEPPHLGVPNARPLWRSEVHPLVVSVERGVVARPDDVFLLDRLGDLATVLVRGRSEHLLLSDGLRTIRLDGPSGTFDPAPAWLRYRVEGLAAAEPVVLTVSRLLALWRTGRFAPSLHPAETRARRWILMLRAWDALAAGADQRRVAEQLLSRSAGEPRWRSREPSMRSQAQRLVRSARWLATGGFRSFLG